MHTRIDKWLWSVRIFKTRKLAKEACDKSRVKINNFTIKASRLISINDIYTIKMKQFTKHVRVVKNLDKRISAKDINQYMDDITPKEEIEKITISKYVQPKIKYTKKGRPTKKERRKLDKIINK
tara:strand:+ start:32 stop:403 length:372 start_codon:yes stop_codon:yes gene_type:complete